MRISILTLGVLLSFPALADEAKKLDFTVPLLDQDSHPILECADYPTPKLDSDCKERKNITLGAIALRALSTPEQGMASEESLKRGRLGLMVYKANSIGLTAEDITRIKNAIAKTYSPLIVAITFPLLDPAEVK